MAQTLTQDDLDAIVAAINAAKPDVNATLSGTAFVHTSGKVWALDGSGNAIASSSIGTAIQAQTDKMTFDGEGQPAIKAIIADAQLPVPAKLSSDGLDDVTAPQAAGRPTTVPGMIRRLFEWTANKKTRDRSTGLKKVYGTDGTTVLETQTQSTTGTTDQETQGA